jgi:glycosyltransferase involved in cell wall biosynthesis
VREAVESALDNGLSEIEVVVFDDGSTDATADVVAAIRHPALRLVRRAPNAGIAAARAAGVTLMRGRYAALLDADDIALPGRFEKQVARLAAADGPDIIGGAIECFGDISGIVRFPQSDAEIRASLLFNASLANPAVCMKLEPLRSGCIGYSGEAGAVAEDYALWVDAMCAGLRFENLPDVLTRYRRHAAAASSALPFSAFGTRNIVIRRRVAQHHFPGMTPAARESLIDILSHRLGVGDRWFNGVYAMSHAALLAPAVPRIAPALMRRLLAEHLLRTLRHAIAHDALANDTLEWMTEVNADFESWRMADGGVLDREIVALFASGA